MKILWNIWIHLGSIACSIVAIVILVGLRDVEADEATLANLWKMGEAFLFLLLMIMYEGQHSSARHQEAGGMNGVGCKN